MVFGPRHQSHILGNHLNSLSNNKFQNLADEELVEILVAELSLGKNSALTEIISRYELPLRRYILRHCYTCRDEVQDLLQEVFISVYRHIYDFNPGLKFSSWIYRITHNAMVSHIRKFHAKKNLIVYEDGIYHSSFLKVEPIQSSSTDDRILAAELEKAIHVLLIKMPDKLRESFVLRFFEEKEYEEIGDILRENVNTISTRIRRARKWFIDQAQTSGLNVEMRN
jgi:RNA polymerase sigma-70 factor, ECF subfamily